MHACLPRLVYQNGIVNRTIQFFQNSLGEENVLTSFEEMRPFCQDWRQNYEGHSVCVVFPETVQEIQQIVNYCRDHQISLVPQGGNTSLCGGATPTNGEVIVKLSRLNRIYSIDEQNYSLVAQSGCTLSSIQKEAENRDLLFPLSLPSEELATIGGNLSTNAGGLNALRYGTMRDLTLGIEAVLPNGERLDTLRCLRKDNTGYHLKHLLIGAEGTLGIITAACLKLFSPHQHRHVFWLRFSDLSNISVLFHEFKHFSLGALSAFELVGSSALSVLKKWQPDLKIPFFGENTDEWFILAELNSRLSYNEKRAMLDSFLDKKLVKNGVFSETKKDINELWLIRHRIPWAEKQEGYAIKHDISLPLSNISIFLKEAQKKISHQWPCNQIVCFGHYGDGNLHYNIFFPEKVGFEEKELVQRACNGVVYSIVSSLNGSIAAEHGVGQLKKTMIKNFKTQAEIDLMRSIKHAIDPSGFMNPGKVIE